MPHATFTFRLDGRLKTDFAEVAKAQDRTAAQLLRVLMRAEISRQREMAEHDAWFRAEIKQSLREADDPNVARIPHEEVREAMRRERARRAVRTDAEVTG